VTRKTYMSARSMNERDLDFVLRWRNHSNIRRFMLLQHEITLSEHRAWFDRAIRDNTRRLLVIEEQGEPRGCVIFSGLQNNSTADWSFYSFPGNPSGTGTRICATALDFAFSEFAVQKVVGQVLDFNIPSIRLHQRLGFTQEEKLREDRLICGRQHFLLFFSLLSIQWTALDKKF
jgi:UDP-4-amino-4,6-dideoxy-N-acetyl-beta-L-altrosamine N-acetyltransferase